MVQTNTVEGPGADAGVMRIKDTKRGLAMALDGNGRWCYLDPKLGAMHAVAESARNVVCAGGKPVAATNCLNFGNPEKPEIMAQFSEVIDGISAACEALATPITGGNVSLYNETLGEGIYPTPVIGVVGIVEDIEHVTRSYFQSAGRDILLLHASDGNTDIKDATVRFGSSEYAKEIIGSVWGLPPSLDLKQEASLQKLVLELIEKRLIESAHDCSDGGLAVTLAESAFKKGIAANVDVSSRGLNPEIALFGEMATQVVISCDPNKSAIIKQMAVKSGLAADLIGQTTGKDNNIEISVDGKKAITASVSDLRQAWATALERALHVDTAEHLVPEILQKS
jgi:phosphoribosylformylglycinamidine synthase